MARRVYLHVGTMKSGTSYLQSLFAANSDLLAEHGIAYAGSRRAHRAAAKLAGSRRLREGSPNYWRELRRDVRQHDGDYLISSELLGPLPKPRIERLAAQLAPAELRVIVTARDLPRVAPSAWQETTQNRGTRSWPEWLDQVLAGPVSNELEAVREPVAFWRQQWLPGTLRRWSAAGGDLWLVTVPRPGADPDELRRRFEVAVGGLPGALVPPATWNPSLGATSADLMRRVNERVGSLPHPTYSAGFKQVLAKQVLRRRAAQESPVSLPRAAHERLAELSRRLVAEVGGLDVHLSGDLADLLPDPWQEPPTVEAPTSDQELLAAALDAITGLGLWLCAQEEVMLDELGDGFSRDQVRQAVVQRLADLDPT